MTKANALHLESEYDWFLRLLNARVHEYFGSEAQENFHEVLAVPPSLNGTASSFSDYVEAHKLEIEERILLLLILAPYIRPQVLDVFLVVKRENGRDITEFGGIKPGDRSWFLPTVDTALFLLAGKELELRFIYQKLFTEENPMIQRGDLLVERGTNRDYMTVSRIRPSDELLDLFTLGHTQAPSFGSEFPAKKVSTSMEWEDLVLENQTLEQVYEILAWIEHGEKIMHEWGMARKLMPGFRSLFYGPPGTGKTLTASLLGKKTEREVYRVDLSLVVSKYIGETEKNLSRIFDKAENKNWILFFDEADALFGKRSQIKDAHDRYANQEVSFLLQRVEDFDGLVILASNAKENIDEAFSRRFQSVISFPMPKSPERRKLWKRAFPEACTLEPGLSLAKIAERFEMAGGSIMNVVRYAVLMAASRESNVILLRDLETGIRREFRKAGRLV